jgi:tetratricopeptide (TPR) repeat protein
MSKSKYWIAPAVVSLGLGVVLALVATCRGQDKPDASSEQPPSGGPELAIRYAALAQDTLRQKVVVPPHFKEAAGLIMAAMKLDPSEPRYPRMLYEAMKTLGDTAGQLKALKAYRDLVPKDQWAAVNFIDLTIGTMQTAEARFDYLNKLLSYGDDVVAPEVRSHAAFRASQTARERGQDDLADSLIGQALKLNPLNLDALRVKLEIVGDQENTTPAERVNVLLSMLKSNPTQPAVTYRLAREAADVGLPEDALKHYTLSVNLSTMTGIPMGREFAVGYASELFMMFQPQLLTATKPITDFLLKQDPGDVEALLIRWLAEKGVGDKDATAKSQQQIVNAAMNRLAVLRGQLGVTGQGATTRPIESPEPLALPELSEDLARLKNDTYAALRQPYAQAVTDLAWYLVYVANKPDEAAKLLPSLKELLSDKNPVIVRIEGWIFLAKDQPDQAGVKFKAVADQDVLARAATYLLWAKNPAEKEPAAAAGRKLLQQNPSGLLAALLQDVMRDLGLKLEAREEAAEVKKALAGFPKDFLRVIDAPQNFYTIQGQMVGGRILFPFGEPLMAQVTIKNVSQYPITVGPEGIIRNDLWFDAQLRGLVQQTVMGAAYERITQMLVLKPGDSVTQTVRLDQGQLAQVLSANPNPAITFYGQVRTNPRGDGGSGPGGYGLPFANITERSGFTLNETAFRTISNTIATGAPGEKVRTMEFVAAEIETLQRQQVTDQTKIVVASFIETLQKTMSDPVPGVATWGTFLTAVHNPVKRPDMIDKLLADPDATRRVLGLLIANSYPPDKQKQMLARLLDSEKEEMVRAYAQGMLEIATITLTQPTTAPAGGAAATQPVDPARNNLPTPGGLEPAKP